jgi:hypothetical protein
LSIPVRYGQNEISRFSILEHESLLEMHKRKFQAG